MKTIPVFLPKFDFPCLNNLTNGLLMPINASFADTTVQTSCSPPPFFSLQPNISETDFRLYTGYAVLKPFRE